MPIIKRNEYRALTPAQITDRLMEVRKELMRLKAQISMGTPPENPGRVRALKKTVARLLTKRSQIKNNPQEATPKP